MSLIDNCLYVSTELNIVGDKSKKARYDQISRFSVLNESCQIIQKGTLKGYTEINRPKNINMHVRNKMVQRIMEDLIVVSTEIILS